MTRSCEQSPFDTLEDTFGLLCAGPRPLAFDGRLVPGLPDRLIPLTELRAILLHPATPYRVRNAALSILLDRARAESGSWTVGLAGVLVFGLRRATSPLCDVCPEKAADIEAEALAGLLEGIAKTEPSRSRLAARLIWLARNRARCLVAKELSQVGRPGRRPAPDAPARPYGHPDLVLAEAVEQGVIDATDAALIGDTRLGLMTLDRAATALGLATDTARKRRRRAEVLVLAWLGARPLPSFASGRNKPRAKTGDTKAAESGPGDSQNSSVRIRPSDPYLGGEGRPRAKRAHDRRPAACQPPTDTRR
jgi:hypothetical protein